MDFRRVLFRSGRSRWAGGYGNLVEINHGGGYQTRFGHLSRRMVGEGQYVRRGTLIGLIGSTGRSTGPHLHYEVRYNGSAVDPTPYIRGFTGKVTRHAEIGRSSCRERGWQYV